MYISHPSTSTVLIIDESSYSEQYVRIREHVDTLVVDTHEKSWHIAAIGSRSYLMRAYEQSGIVLGAFLPISAIEQSIADVFNFESIRIIVHDPDDVPAIQENELHIQDGIIESTCLHPEH